MVVPLNRWTVGVVITASIWIWALSVRSTGDYDFGPALAGFGAMLVTVALWCGLLLATVL